MFQEVKSTFNWAYPPFIFGTQYKRFAPKFKFNVIRIYVRVSVWVRVCMFVHMYICMYDKRQNPFNQSPSTHARTDAHLRRFFPWVCAFCAFVHRSLRFISFRFACLCCCCCSGSLVWQQVGWVANGLTPPPPPAFPAPRHVLSTGFVTSSSCAWPYARFTHIFCFIRFWGRVSLNLKSREQSKGRKITAHWKQLNLCA